MTEASRKTLAEAIVATRGQYPHNALPYLIRVFDAVMADEIPVGPTVYVEKLQSQNEELRDRIVTLVKDYEFKLSQLRSSHLRVVEKAAA